MPAAPLIFCVSQFWSGPKLAQNAGPKLQMLDQNCSMAWTTGSGVLNLSSLLPRHINCDIAVHINLLLAASIGCILLGQCGCLCWIAFTRMVSLIPVASFSMCATVVRVRAIGPLWAQSRFGWSSTAARCAGASFSRAKSCLCAQGLQEWSPGCYNSGGISLV